MNSDKRIEGRWEYLRVVLLKPTFEFLATGTFFTFLFVATWWRDNFASEEWKHRLELKGFLPHLRFTTWLSIALSFLVYLIFSRAYELWRLQTKELVVLRMRPIPEFVIDFAKDDQEVVGFRLKNTSQRNLYNVVIGNVSSRVGEICWWDSYFTCLEAGTGEVILKPCSHLGSLIRFHDMPLLLKALQDNPGETNPDIVGKLNVFADDADGNKYRFSADIELWNGFTWRIFKTDRVLQEEKGLD